MAHVPLPPFTAYAGSRSPKMLILGEAWGRTEEELQMPFVGASGRLLFQILGEAIPEEPEVHALAMKNQFGLGFLKWRDEWLERVGIGLTNVFALRPFENKLEHLCESKKTIKELLHPDSIRALALPALKTPGKFLHPQYLPELDRLAEEIKTSQPNLVLCLGNSACWAAHGVQNIGSVRGSISETNGKNFPKSKSLASYHPAAVMRMWDWRPLLMADIAKAWREAQSREIIRPRRELIINPDLEDIERFAELIESGLYSCLAVDTETKARQITCIGFAPTRDRALVVPFWDFGAEGKHYWKSEKEEILAHGLVNRILRAPIPKLFQNGMYDLQYLIAWGIRPKNCLEDTMLMHHSMYPELNKGLGFLGSIYTSEASWKLMRHFKGDTEKADE